MADIQTQMPVKLTNGTNTVAVTAGNALTIDGSAVTQPVSISGTVPVSIAATVTVAGSVTVSNFPSTQTVNGSVSVSNFPATQPVSGSVSVSNFPATQPVSGTVVVSSVGGTVAVSQGEVSTGLVSYYGTSSAVANNSSGTITYTVTTGKTFYLKQILASASGGPCKVALNYGSGPTVVAVAFFSAAMPYVNLTFAQPVSIPAGAFVNVVITNNAGAAQDVYASIFGHEV